MEKFIIEELSKYPAEFKLRSVEHVDGVPFHNGLIDMLNILSSQLPKKAGSIFEWQLKSMLGLEMSSEHLSLLARTYGEAFEMCGGKSTCLEILQGYSIDIQLHHQNMWMSEIYLMLSTDT